MIALFILLFILFVRNQIAFDCHTEESSENSYAYAKINEE